MAKSKTDGIAIQGLEELKKKLSGLSDKRFKKNVVSPVKKGAGILRREMKKRVPVDSGRLRKSIRVKTLRGTEPMVVVGASYSKKYGQKHAHLIEFGTAVRRPKGKRPLSFKGKDGSFVQVGEVSALPARPFFRPTYDAYGEAALNRAANEIANLIHKTLK